MMPLTATSEGERWLRALAMTLAQHRRQEALLSSSPVFSTGYGRLRVLPDSVWSGQVRRQGTLLRLISTVEAFASQSLAARLERIVPPPRRAFLEDTYVKAEEQATSSWPRMKEAYGKYLTIKHSAFPDNEDLAILVDARNIVAHGLGDLTPRFVRQDYLTLASKLTKLSISLHRNSIDVSETCLSRCFSIGQGYIGWLDCHLDAYDKSV